MTLAIFDRLIVGSDGDPLDGATVEIRRESDNALASLFTDRAGTTPTAEAGTITADSGGRATCYMAGGAYKVTVTKSPFTDTYRYVAHGTMGERDWTDDVEYLSVRFTPTDQPANAETGQVFYPNANTQLGENHSAWVGPGPYVRVPMSTEGQSPEVFTWKPLGQWGLWPSTRKTGSTSITQFDAGRLLVMDSSEATNVTFPVDVLRSDQVASATNSSPSLETAIANKGTGTITIVAGSGVTLKSASGLTAVLPGAVVRCVYNRTGSGTADLYIMKSGGAGEVPTGTQAVVTLDSTGAAVASAAPADGTVVINAAGQISAVAKLAETSFEEVAITASRELTAADANFRIVAAGSAASGVVRKVLKPLHGTPATTIALQVPANTPHGTEWLIRRPGNQEGAVTLALSGAGTINGGTSAVTIPRKRLFAVYVSNINADAPTVETSLTLEDTGTPVFALSGTVTLDFEDHNGAHVSADDDVTIPTTPGMSGSIVATAGLDVLFNATTVATLTAGDILSYIVRDATTIDATKAARLVPT